MKKKFTLSCGMMCTGLISGKDEVRLRKDADALLSSSAESSQRNSVSRSDILDAIQAKQRQRQQDKDGAA